MSRPFSTCDKTGCEAEAVYRPILRLTTDGHTYLPLNFSEQKMCQRHKNETSLDNLISAQDWQSIEDLYRGMGLDAPNRDLTQLEWGEE